jgi:hypothetical protein
LGGTADHQHQGTLHSQHSVLDQEEQVCVA